MSIDFDLAAIPLDIRRQIAQTVTSPKTYERLLLQLDVSVSHESYEIALVCGHTVGRSSGGWNNSFLLGTIGPILFREAGRE